MSTAVVIVLGFLVPLAALWLVVLVGRPAVARARVEHEALVIRDRVMEGILAGDVGKDDPRGQDLLRFCDFLANHAKELSITVAFAVSMGMREAGVDPVERAQLKADDRAKPCAGTNEGGRRRLQEAEVELDHAIARYFVHGSKLWWALSPAQQVYRYARSRQMISQRDPTIVVDPPRPGELATEMREASRGHAFPPAFWTVHGLKAA